ncbi:MAG: type III-A CRISPR-associated protein Csm2 [Bacteroidota bacterium]
MIDTNYFREYFTDNPVNYILKSYREATETDEFLSSVDRFAFRTKNDIPVSQLKTLYSEIRPLETADLNRLKMLRINLAFIAGKNDKSQATQKLCALLDALLQNVNEDSMDSFKDFFEALLAYYKLHNPKAK